MKLPNAAHAIVEIEKLRDYCLSASHPRGRHKARVFSTTLGITAEDAEELRNAILSAVLTEEATSTERDEYGQRYTLDFTMTRQGRQAAIRTAWIVRTGEDYSRLTSCYVL
ncbi:MAG: hypothetical protein IPO22_24300 [Anaerolineales bacterium]|nr:hypothetical protein [Anaerolineales bacterium]